MMRSELGKAFSGRVLNEFREFIGAMIEINCVPLSGHRTVIVNLTLVTRMAILINVRSHYGPNRTEKERCISKSATPYLVFRVLIKKIKKRTISN